MTELTPAEKFSWIVKAGWHGLCPRCGEGKMFVGKLKLASKCDRCDLDYRFASPDDGPAFFSLMIVAFPLTFLVVWFQLAFEPPAWVHLITSVPLMTIGCLLPLRPIKGWLVTHQYVNKAQEAGSRKVWDQLHNDAKQDGDSGNA